MMNSSTTLTHFSKQEHSRSQVSRISIRFLFPWHELSPKYSV